MADAWRKGAWAPTPPPRRLASIVVHPARMSAEPDTEGFREVHSRWRWRCATAPASRPVPADLVGKCFNCFAEDHVRADCKASARCFNCKETGHHACDCPLPPVLGCTVGKRGRSPYRAAGGTRGARRRRRASSLGRADSPADTVSGRSASTGCEPSVPRVCEPPTPESPRDAPVVEPGNLLDAQVPRSSEVAVDADIVGAVDAVEGTDAPASTTVGPDRLRTVPTSLLRRAMEPPASPETRARSPLLAMAVIPRIPAIQEAEDALSLALVALVLGMRPAVTPAMVREQLLVHFGISEERVTVRWTSPDDFIARFSNADDLERVLNSPWPVSAPFTLRWRR